jgi:hypothetical protein
MIMGLSSKSAACRDHKPMIIFVVGLVVVVVAVAGCGASPDNASACASFDRAYTAWYDATHASRGHVGVGELKRIRAADTRFGRALLQTRSAAGSEKLSGALFALDAAINQDTGILDHEIHGGQVSTTDAVKAAHAIAVSRQAVRETCPAP